jgi:hypothetical protein
MNCNAEVRAASPAPTPAENVRSSAVSTAWTIVAPTLPFAPSTPTRTRLPECRRGEGGRVPMTRRLIRNCSCCSATAKAWRFAQLPKGLSYLVHEGVTVGGVLIVRVGR